MSDDFFSTFQRFEEARSSDLCIATGMVVIDAGINDVAQRNLGAQGIALTVELLDSGDDLVAHLRGAGIHHQNAILAYRDRNIATSADHHIDVSMHWPNVNFTILRGC